VVTREYDTALRPQGLRITQIAILTQLANLQPVTVTQLADALASDRSALARDIAILKRAGLVASMAKRGDRRASQLSLTAAGERKLAECAEAWHALQAKMRDSIGAADVAALIALSDRVVGALSQ
jgi:DNA-binding MarR family transcriptional regulator